MADPKRPQNVDINALFRMRNQQIRQETSDIDNLMTMFDENALKTDTVEGYETAIQNIDKISGEHSYNKIRGNLLKEKLNLEKSNQMVFDEIQTNATNLLGQVKGGATDGMIDLINNFSTSITNNKSKFNDNEITSLNETLGMIENLNVLNQTKLTNTQLDAIAPQTPEDQALEDFAQNIGSVSKSVQYTEARVGDIGARREAQAKAVSDRIESSQGYAGIGKENYQTMTKNLVGINTSVQNLKRNLATQGFVIPIDFATENIVGDGKNVIDKTFPKDVLKQYNKAIVSIAGAKMVQETNKTFYEGGKNLAMNRDGSYTEEFIDTLIAQIEAKEDPAKLSENLEKRLGPKSLMTPVGNKSDFSVQLTSFWKEITSNRNDILDIMANKNPSNPLNTKQSQGGFNVMDLNDVIGIDGN